MKINNTWRLDLVISPVGSLINCVFTIKPVFLAKVHKALRLRHGEKQE